MSFDATSQGSESVARHGNQESNSLSFWDEALDVSSEMRPHALEERTSTSMETPNISTCKTAVR